MDLHKGFNKIDHKKTITIFSDMNTPNLLLKIIANYLSNRKISIGYRKHVSASRDMPGRTAAGTILGLNLFLILFNGAGPRTNVVSIVNQITQPFKRRQPIRKMKVKWVDDVTVCAALDLKSVLIPEDRPVPQPLSYHTRTGHRLPRQSNLMQDELDLLVRYTESHLMAINRAKTKALLCNTRIKWDFLPELNLGTEENIEVVEELKIVGYIFRSDMKTCSNTAYLTAKAYKRMWFLRRLKALGASTSQLLDTLEKQVMSVLWLGDD